MTNRTKLDQVNLFNRSSTPPARPHLETHTPSTIVPSWIAYVHTAILGVFLLYLRLHKLFSLNLPTSLKRHPEINSSVLPSINIIHGPIGQQRSSQPVNVESLDL